jgi:hypothetical protein
LLLHITPPQSYVHEKPRTTQYLSRITFHALLITLLACIPAHLQLIQSAPEAGDGSIIL